MDTGRLTWCHRFSFLLFGIFLAAVGYSSAPVLASTVSFSSQLKSDYSKLCVQSSSGSDAAIQEPCISANNQNFEWIAGPSGYYQLKNVANGLCLDVQGASTLKGAVVQLYTCKSLVNNTGANNQLWKKTALGGGYQLISRLSGLCLGNMNSLSAGTGLQQWTCLGSTQTSQLWLINAQTSTASTSAKVIPSSLFGMQTHGPTEWPTVSIGVLGKGSQTVWPYIERSRGVRNWSVLDAYVSASETKHVPMIYTFEYTPAWAIAGASSATCGTLYDGTLACPQPPDSMTDWTNFVSALVSRYCPSGVPNIQYYELYNEPYDVEGSNHVQLSPSQLAMMAHAAYGIIRSQCPAAKIISPSMATVSNTSYYLNYATAYFEALGPVGTDPVDIAGVHIYTYDESVNTPEDLRPGGALNSAGVASLIKTYAPGKPIWNTEGSWQRSNTGLFASDSLHAAFIARWYLMHWAGGFSQANWYAWDDGSLGTLCNHISGTSTCAPITEPVTAYQQTYDWMVGSSMNSNCAPVSSGSSVWKCGLVTSAGVQTWAVWNTAGSSSYTVPSGFAHYKNLAGTTNAISGSTVSIGPAPILLVP